MAKKKSVRTKRQDHRSRRTHSSSVFDTPSPRRRKRPDSTGLYLEEIGSYKRLSREEEVALSKQVKEGDDDAKTILIEANLRLVVSICKDFTRGRFDLMELVSPGNEGLMIAAGKYDGEMGVPFANYAALWIKQRVMKYVAERGFVVRVPQYHAATINKTLRARKLLMQELGREPGVMEIAESVEGCSMEEIEEVMRILQPSLEFDAPVKEGEESTTFGSYFGESTEDAEQREEGVLEEMDLKKAIADSLELLEERDAQVLMWYFGIGRTRALDLDQIALRLDITRERVRQIKSAALKQLAEESGLDSFYVG